ncbi:MAG TPA: NADH-quinone oxidoreductase subunit A [Candidatus Dormibacteraeota bacterium]|nr:NADH-quinone oxidoreductase subunit A [Candidatus Dormibacteraeota bacterium]
MHRASIPLLLYALLVTAFPVVALLVARSKRPALTVLGAKLYPHESGIPPEDGAPGKYSVRFFIFATLFVIFEVQMMFLIPWAISFRGWVAAHMAVFALIWMVISLGILFVGYTWLRRHGHCSGPE